MHKGDMNEIGCIWIRQHRGKVQVLVETGAEEWKEIFCEPMDPTTPTSHCVHPAGVRARPFLDMETFEPKGESSPAVPGGQRSGQE
jgi:hypothetical protein